MDVKTLFILNTLVAIFMAGAMFYYMSIQKTHKGFSWWASTSALAAFFYILVFLRGLLPDFITMLLANTGISTLLIIRLQGVKKFFGRKNISFAYLLIPAFDKEHENNVHQNERD